MALWSVFNWHRGARNEEPVGQVTRGIQQRLFPSIGDSILIEVIPSGPDRLPGLVSARVAEIRGRKLIVADVKPASGGSNAGTILLGGALIRVSFAIDGHRYRFELPGGRRRIQTLNRDQYALTIPMRIDRVEQRRYFRMLLETPTWYRPVNSPRHWRLPGRIVDLSGGGMLLATDEPVTAGARLVVQTPSGKEGSTVDMACEIIACTPRPVRTRASFAVRLKFVEGTSRAAEEERDAIVAYVFEQQRLMLRARKLTLR